MLQAKGLVSKEEVVAAPAAETPAADTEEVNDAVAEEVKADE
jgi:hypothetical protein